MGELAQKEKHENMKDESTKEKTIRDFSAFRFSCFRVPLLLALRTFLLASVAILFFRFDCRLAHGQDQPAKTSLGDDELKDITGIEEAVRPPARAWWPYTLGLAAVLTMSLFLVGWRYYRRQPDKPELRPSSWALAELDRIESLARSAGQDQLEPYPAMLSEVIRVYLERRFQLRAPRQTTPEFLSEVKDSTFLKADHRQLLKDFLEGCDLAKFAHVQFSLEECRALAQSARKFVEETAD